MTEDEVAFTFLALIIIFWIIDYRSDFEFGDKVYGCLITLYCLAWIIGGLALLVYWLDEDWVCYTTDGDIIYTESEPDGDWIESTGGILYPRDRISECAER